MVKTTLFDNKLKIIEKTGDVEESLYSEGYDEVVYQES